MQPSHIGRPLALPELMALKRHKLGAASLCGSHLKFGLTKPRVLKQFNAITVAMRTDQPRSVDADGELVTSTPATFALLRGALKVMVPRTPPPHHGFVIDPLTLRAHPPSGSEGHAAVLALPAIDARGERYQGRRRRRLVV